MARLHTWAGLIVGWVLFFVFLTGTLGYLRFEIDRWMMPERPLATAAPPPAAILAPLAATRLQRVAPDAGTWTIYLPTRRTLGDLRIFWTGSDGGASGSERLDPVSGLADTTRIRDTGGGEHLYEMHYRLHYLPYDAAILVVGACTMLLLLALLTGIVIHRRIFADFFTFRPGKGQRSWLDAHNLLAVAPLPFHLMITLSGLVFFLFAYLPAAGFMVYGREAEDVVLEALGPPAPPPVATDAPRISLPDLAPLLQQAERRWGTGQVERVLINGPGRAGSTIILFARSGHERTLMWDPHGMRFDADGQPADTAPVPAAAALLLHDLLLDLHVADYAGPLLRTMHVLCGLAGTGMIGAGLMLWSAKRRGRGATGGTTLVDVLNLGTIVGLPSAIAAYFWANRLLPLDLSDRHEWEVHAMFAAWIAALAYAGLARHGQAWRDMCRIAALAFGLLPLVNLLTTDRHLGVTITAGDWVLAGFDLSALVIGLAFLLVAHRVQLPKVAS